MPPCSCNCKRQVWRSYIEEGRSLHVAVGGVDRYLYDPHECMKRLREDYPELAALVAAEIGVPQDAEEASRMNVQDA